MTARWKCLLLIIGLLAGSSRVAQSEDVVRRTEDVI